MTKTIKILSVAMLVLGTAALVDDNLDIAISSALASLALYNHAIIRKLDGRDLGKGIKY